ncbi:ribonuclease III [Dacryopinax primogenitus]|uniref:Ribonuclease III n=1 Tax=Dacryopinax primogenitus (strain DJM 731) TaxID=1858805 RepID=M5FRM0_DACPD|nr:ribonuclease III [Dacryopinax primogenitus]EJT97649.1 ribonuclease III [Dacryopinax primogenitus]
MDREERIQDAERSRERQRQASRAQRDAESSLGHEDVALGVTDSNNVSSEENLRKRKRHVAIDDSDDSDDVEEIEFELSQEVPPLEPAPRHIYGGKTRAASTTTTELVLPCDPSPFTEASLGPLYNQIHALDPDELVFKKNFKSVQLLVTELGPYAADMIWQRYAGAQEARRNGLVKEKRVPASFSEVEEMRSKLVDMVRAHKFPSIVLDPQSTDCNASPRLLTLLQVLKQMMAKEKDRFRGIIFVYRRTTAKALADLLNRNAQVLPNVRARPLIGSSAVLMDPNADHLTKTQATTQFRDGTINLLVTTGIGVDLSVERCSIVIVFDSFSAHAAGQLRQSHLLKITSIFLILIEKGKQKDIQALSAFLPRRSKEKSEEESTPPAAEHPRSTGIDSEDEDQASILVPETGARVSALDALQVLTRYVSIKEKSAVSLNVDYHVMGENNRIFRCTIRFPPSAELEDVTSESCPSKAAARRQAAYMACEELNARGLLGALVAQAGKKLKTITKVTPPSVFDNEVGVDVERKLSKGRSRKDRSSKLYPRKKPDVWNTCLLVHNDVLFPFIIHLDARDAKLPGVYRTMCLLTRIRLPDLAPFELYFPELKKSEDQATPPTVTARFLRSEPLHLEPEQLIAVHRYTIRVVRSVTSRQYICQRDKMVYYLLPLKLGWSPRTRPTNSPSVYAIEDEIDWADVEAGAGQLPYLPLDMEKLEEEVKDAVLQDRQMEFTRKYEPVRVRHDLTPLSKPKDSEREQQYASILEFCRANIRNFKGIEDESQPLIEVGKMAPPLSRLSPLCHSAPSSRNPPAKYLMPELCVKYCLSLSSYRTSMILPSVMARVEEMLLVQECNSVVFHDRLDEVFLLPALTSPSAGAGYDYQRLELLGDSFLKYISSIFLFVTCPQDGEGSLHIHRQRIISNSALQFHSDRVGQLPQYIQSRQHSPRQWCPPNFLLYHPCMASALDTSEKFIQGMEERIEASNDGPTAGGSPPESGVTKALESHQANAETSPDNSTVSRSPMPYSARERALMREEQHQELGDKSVADVAEAVLGAAWLTGQREMALYVCHILGLPMTRMGSWDFLRDHAHIFFHEELDIGPLSQPKVEAVEAILGHKFKNPFLAATALTHSSMSSTDFPCYERLEFIGDAILDFVTVRLLYMRWGELHEGWLTMLKGAIVSNAALAAFCVDLGLHHYIIHDSPHLVETVSSYAKEITKAKEEDLAAAAAEDRAPGEYWVTLEPPKVLSDIVEALLGAIYVSDSFDPSGYENVFDRLFKPFFMKRVSLNTLSQHPTSLLFALLQQRGCHRFELTKTRAETDLLTEVQCDFVLHGKVLATSIHSSSAGASRRASAMALELIQTQPELLDKLCSCTKIRNESEAQQPPSDPIPVEEEEEDLLAKEDLSGS